jgi:hypothetical protein
MVGDRLDTDIDGASNAGVDSLLVMTGVTDLAQLVAVPAGRRPTYLSPDLSGLFETHSHPDLVDGRAELGGWRAVVDGTLFEVTGDGSPGDWWRVVAVAAWAELDRSGSPVDTSRLTPPQP